MKRIPDWRKPRKFGKDGHYYVTKFGGRVELVIGDKVIPIRRSTILRWVRELDREYDRYNEIERFK